MTVAGTGLPAYYQVHIVSKWLQKLRAGFLAEFCELAWMLCTRIGVTYINVTVTNDIQ